MKGKAQPRLIIGITGASGTIYAVRALELLRKLKGKRTSS